MIKDTPRRSRFRELFLDVRNILEGCRRYLAKEEEISEAYCNLAEQSDVEPCLLEDLERVAGSVVGKVGKYVAGSKVIWGNSSCDDCRDGAENLCGHKSECNMHPCQRLAVRNANEDCNTCNSIMPNPTPWIASKTPSHNQSDFPSNNPVLTRPTPSPISAHGRLIPIVVVPQSI